MDVGIRIGSGMYEMLGGNGNIWVRGWGVGGGKMGEDMMGRMSKMVVL